ncbi:hypothetical protein [Leptospira brenneri]|uniref:Uncharacterized protein n=1 Tax=Leptospira brenneri TaxID=2023182 RepID=A0A2M9XYE4_9LEPT|nr:hypothetical protein [Leptospira brenneri]PJZ44330.1 hypothetical protein CH361_14550 [Leptospira brenneri]TGK95324.1 hypothetical protein EHQ30_01410 [Leptospira brenneri]
MKKSFLTILILIFSFQCKIFKPSDLDPSQDLGTLQTLLRYLALADAFNTYSQTVAFMKFTDSNGNPYNAYKVEYSVFNEADENGTPTSPYGETGNIQTYTLTLDANGRGFLSFSERGIATLTVKTPADIIVGNASFRIYNGITKQSFSLLSQSGATQFTLEDLANYRNRMASYFSFTPLGSANGRQFIYLQVQTASPPNSYSVGYIASSADGENYDQVTKIEGVNIQITTEEYRLKISTPTFNGSEYVFFLSEERWSYPALVFQDNKNLFIRIPAFSPPYSVTAQSIALPTNYRLFSDVYTPPWYYPSRYLGSDKYLITPMLSTTPRPLIVQLDLVNTVDLVNDFGCSTSVLTGISSVAYQVIAHSGFNYLQCPTITFGNTFVSKSIRIPDLVSNQITFDAVSPMSFESPIFPVQDQLVALLYSAPTYYGYTFPNGSYSFSNPTITKNASPIPGFASTIPGNSSRLRTIKSSNSIHYFLLSNVPDFSVSPTIEIYRSTDGLTSASLLATVPTAYNSSIATNAEQFQSANGKLNYSYYTTANTGIGSFPVYLTYFTNDDGTWEALPRLIKIR